MSKPAAYFPSTDFPNYQEHAIHTDTNGALTQKADVVLTSGYAASGAVAVISTTGGTPFANWPSYGFIQNLTTNEVLFYNSITGGTQLNVDVNGRACQGSVAAAGLNGHTVRFIEGRMLGTVLNAILSEITALNKIKTVNQINTSPKNLAATDAFQTWVATGAMVFNLPASTVNLRYRFVNASGGITINAQAGDVIYEGPIVSNNSTGNVVTTDTMAALEIVCVAAGKWAIVNKIGTWSVT